VRRVKSTATLLVAPLIACSGPTDRQSAAANAASVNAQGTQSPSLERISMVRSELAAAYSELGTELELNSNGALAGSVSRGRDAWNRRISQCTDDSCRIALLDDQLNRVRYALGRNGRPVQGLPWRVGNLSIDRGDASGGLRLLPIIDNRLIVYGDMAQMPEARWMCDLRAEGQVGADGAAEIVTLDEFRQRYRLEPRARNRLTITFPSPGIDRACGLNGALEGDYTVREVPAAQAPPTS
jgi:hypothetical protein